MADAGFERLHVDSAGSRSGAILILWALTRQGVLCLLALGAGYRLFVHKDFAPEVDYVALGQFVG